MYICITILCVWNGKLLFHFTLNIPGQSGFPVVCGIGNGKFAFHSILPVWNSSGMLHFFSLIPYIQVNERFKELKGEIGNVQKGRRQESGANVAQSLV